MSYSLDIIKKAMDEHMAEIYVILAENGPLTVPKIQVKTNLSRTIIYEVLSNLLIKDFVEYYKIGRNAYYKIAHPSKLYDLSEQKKQESLLFNEDIQKVVNIFTGNYNLSANKPGIRFFEGEEGIFEALDNLAANFETDSELLSFVKVKPVEQEKNINNAIENFIKKRITKNVKTLVLAMDSPEAQLLLQNDKNALRETRLVPTNNLPFDFPGGEILIYKNDVCMVTVEGNTNLALSISSPAIAQMLKTFFFSEWSLLQK